VHLAKFTQFLPHFNKNCLEKNFPVALGGAPAPPALPGYAYVLHRYYTNSTASRQTVVIQSGIEKTAESRQ